MIRLNLARGPREIALGHGVTVTVLPLTSPMMMAARERLRHLPEAGPADLIEEIGKASIIAWTGVLGEDGAAVPVSDETVAALLGLYPMAEAFERLHLAPALLLAEEKNASAPSPNGTSAGATAIAQNAPGAAPRAPTT